MRALIWIITLFAVAVGLSLIARYNEGYVLVFDPPYRFDFSLTLFAVVLIGTVFVLFGLGHLFSILYNFPKRVVAYRQIQARKAKETQAEELLVQALNAALAGDPAGAYAKAQQAGAAGAAERLVAAFAPVAAPVVAPPSGAVGISAVVTPRAHTD
jgi:HemY protein